MKNKKPLVTRLQEQAMAERGLGRTIISGLLEEAIAEIFRLERNVKPLPRSADDTAP